MDFSSLGNGNPFYVLRKGEKPILEVGMVKSKTQPRAKWPTQNPNVMAGLQVQQVIDVVATINGKDETFSEIPINVEIAEQIPYHKVVISETEKMLEVLNPQYAENKKQARTIIDLERRQADTDKKLDTILTILQKLDSPPSSTKSI